MIILPEDKKIIARLPPDEVKALMLALLSEDADTSELSIAAMIVYDIIADRNERISKKQSGNGGKGGAPRGNQNARKQSRQDIAEETTQDSPEQATSEETTQDNPKQVSVEKTTQNNPEQAKQPSVTESGTSTVTESVTGTDSPTLTLPGDAREIFRTLVVQDDAKQAHKQVAIALSVAGYSCTKEYPVADRGDGKPGRIDIVAQKDGITIAIEIDRLSVRDKSVFKLQQMPDAVRVILLRDGIEQFVPGIEVINLQITEEAKAARESKTTDLEPDEFFEQFWAVYPKRQERPEALKEWAALKVDAELLAKIIDGVRKWLSTDQWQRSLRENEGQFVPKPANFLNGRRWEDQIPVIATFGRAGKPASSNPFWDRAKQVTDKG